MAACCLCSPHKREEQIVVGTTDTFTGFDPDNARATNEDVRYLLDAANRFFPRAGLTPDDVIAAWAGIRPLIPTQDATPGAASREHAVATSAQGLISVTGGKLTTYRVMAADVIRAVLQRLGRRGSVDPTKSTPLPGGDFGSLSRVLSAAITTTGDEELAWHLATTYGTRWPRVWAEIDRRDGRPHIVDGLPYRLGELRYAIQSEMALSLGDLLIRRTHVAFETRDHGLGVTERVADVAAPLLGWDAAELTRALDAYAREITRIFSID